MRALAVHSFVVALSSGAAVLVAAAPCAAFVRTYTVEGCNPVFWAQSCVYVTTDATPFPDMPLATIERVANEAIGGWEAPMDSFLQLLYLPASGPREVGLDGLQVIKFRSVTWCRPPDATSGQPTCYDPSATAITTVTYVSAPGNLARDGLIVDADIELNAVSNYFYDADTDPAPQPGTRRPMDLWNVLAHELGHVQGLDHVCRTTNWDMPACTLDSTGAPVIECSTVVQGKATDPALETIFEATMYPSTVPEETSKRQPKADDLTGIADTYPTADDPHICEMPGFDAGVDSVAPVTTAGTVKAGCSAAGGLPAGSQGRGWGIFAALGLGLMGARARRRRRSR
jgi:hypothetical protein